MNKLLPVLAAVVGIAMTGTGVGLLAVTPRQSIPVGLNLEQVVGYLVLQAALLGVGFLLTSRRPRNPVGWLLVAGGLVSASQFLFAGYAVYGLSSGSLPGPAVAAWLYSWTGVGIGLSIGWIPAVFPNGRVGSVWARAGLACLVVGSIALMSSTALRPGPLAEMPGVRNPFGWDDGAPIIASLLGIGLAGALAAIVLMFKHLTDLWRGSSGIERQQLKWLLWSVMVLFITMVFAIPGIFGPPDQTGSDATARFIARVASALATATVPIGIAFAVLRYRLYEIDVLINRTLVYGALTAALGAMYLAGVVLLQALLRSFTSGSELAVAASTLGVVALFQPLRSRIQGTVDRRFYRSRYDAARTLDAFAARLRDEVDLDSVCADLVDVVRDTVRPAHASVWLRERR